MILALEMGTFWPPDMSKTPPAFQDVENGIWQRFLDGYGDSYQGFYYNVHIGEDRFPGTAELDQYQRMQQDLALKKIDAVGRRGSTWDLIEVRRHASGGSIGQLLMYETMWTTYAPKNRPYTLTIVTDHIDIDSQLAARDRGMSVFVV